MEVRQITPSQHFTEPPPRFSEASLVKELERLGIGRPSTYAQIISTLTAREYVKLEQRRFTPTELGETVETDHGGQFPSIFNVEFTSRNGDWSWTRSRKESWAGRRCWRDFYGPFSKALAAVNLGAIVAEAHGLNRGGAGERERCPKCGAKVELRTGRFGPYFACVNYKTDLRLREVAQEGRRPRTGPPTRSASCAARRW